MADKAFVITESDAKILKSLLDSHRSKRQNELKFLQDEPLPTSNPRRTKRGYLTSSLAQGTPLSLETGTIDVWSINDDDDTPFREFSGESLDVWDDGHVPEGGLSAGTWIQIVKEGRYWWYDGGCNQPGTGTGS